LSWVTVEIQSVDPLNQLISIETSHFSMYAIGAAPADETSGGGGGGGGCFIAAVQRAEATFFIADWPISSVSALLALIGFMCLGKRRKG